MRKLKKYNNIPYCLVMGGRHSGKSPFTPFMIKIQDLEEQLKLTEKALELACYDMTRSLFPNKWQLMIPTMIEQYKEDAKEILNGN